MGPMVGCRPTLSLSFRDALISHAHRRAVVAVEGVGKGNYRVQVVIAAGKLQDHQHGVFLG